jgi:hypothetical protein
VTFRTVQLISPMSDISSSSETEICEMRRSEDRNLSYESPLENPVLSDFLRCGDTGHGDFMSADTKIRHT